jgi:hypothetical protein
VKALGTEMFCNSGRDARPEAADNDSFSVAVSMRWIHIVFLSVCAEHLARRVVPSGTKYQIMDNVVKNDKAPHSF